MVVRTTRHLPVAVLSATLVGSAVLLAGAVFWPRAAPPPLPAPPTAAPPAAPPAKHRAEFFDQHVQGIIAVADQANRQAAKRCIATIDQRFAKYARGIEPFATDMTSMSTRFRILRKMRSDWWNERTDVRRFVQAKFEKHVFSESRIQRDVAQAIAQFRADVEANQMQMLADARAALSSADLPDVQLPEYGQYLAQVNAELQSHLASSGADSVTSGLVALVASEVGSVAAGTLVGGMIGRAGIAAATSVAAAGGASATGAAAGGVGGTAAGPIGTAIGAGIGLAIGVAIDWWMTASFEAKLKADLNEYLRQMQRLLVRGKAGNNGLANALNTVCDGLREAYREQFYRDIVGVML
ncbi:MAG: hypothetical protein WD851_03610 [Pirellulales bacterium]